ncbi:hypothetical protein LNTAR_19367 [Lentisphaera araneosa HTCC2155]|uniref:Lipoprotein n=1 Tax=Lentisphaera araneosa HTCC2155 TaxID=313628 RepID=A6DQT9_9BACT|nr:hypothetical protein [Lentisphaera araneosa]EDM25989.1 hypothetical protein LNTAR_19367 [Lentisphaera araneosa HTCC2155]
MNKYLIISFISFFLFSCSEQTETSSAPTTEIKKNENKIVGNVLDGYVPVADSPEEFLINTFKKVNSGQMTLKDFTAIYTEKELITNKFAPKRKFESIKKLDLTKRFDLKSRDYKETGSRQIIIKSEGETTGDFFVKKIDGKYRFTNMDGE